MLAVGMRRLCRVGLAAVLATALCVLTLVDMPPQLLEPPTDYPPTHGSEPPGTRSIVAYSWARRLALDYRPSRECTMEKTRSANTSDKVRESWSETIPERLFLYSGHLDIRVTGYPSVRVIGVKREPMTSGILFCTIWQEDQEGTRSFSMEALVSDIWLDEWSATTTGYTGILITCPLPDHASRPSRVYIGASACYQNPSHSLVVNQPMNVERKFEFTVCIKGLDFDEDISQKLIAFIELSRILGAGMIYIYVFSVHENVSRVLTLYESSNVIRWFRFKLPGDLPNDATSRRKLFAEDVWVKRRMELIPYNHCFYDNLYQSNFIVPIDIDEMIIPVKEMNWSDLIMSERKKLGKSFEDYASYAVRNVFFFPELQRKTIHKTNSGLDVDGFEDLNYLDNLRTSIASPKGDSVKSFISTKRTLTVHNHYALMTLNPSTRRAHHFDTGDALKHHHRRCDSGHLDCDLMMNDVTIDDSALRYAEKLKARVKITLANLNALIE